MRIAREEVFGPVVSLIEFETFEEAIEIANSIDYGLSTALYTKDVNRAFTAMRDLEAGITYINAPTIGAEVHLPFGGVKHTGNGHREGLGRSTSSRRGKRCTWITPTSCKGRRSTMLSEGSKSDGCKAWGSTGSSHFLSRQRQVRITGRSSPLPTCPHEIKCSSQSHRNGSVR